MSIVDGQIGIGPGEGPGMLHFESPGLAEALDGEEQRRRAAELVGGVAAVATDGSTEGDTRGQLERTIELLSRAEAGEADRSKEVFAIKRSPDNYFEILVDSDVTLEQYRERTSAELWDLMLEETEPLVGKNLYIFSSTYEGGGVAMQEPPLINFLQRRGVNVHWLVSEPDGPAFLVTKKMHNLQQDMLDPEVQWTEEDSGVHAAYGQKNIRGMLHGKQLTDEEVAAGKSYGPVEGLAEADVYWFEDPQLIGGMPDLMALNPNATYVYRNHIQTDRDLMAREGSPQQRIYQHIHQTCGVDLVDTYVSHPVAQFVPERSADAQYKEAYMPPVSDEHEDLIRELKPAEIQEKQNWINAQIAQQNFERQDLNASLYGEAARHIDDQAPIDWSRSLDVEFSRYDWAKFKECHMMLAKKVVDRCRELNIPDHLIPHFVIAGNGATDDLDREIVLNHTLNERRTRYADYADFITVVGLAHDYTAVNALFRSAKYSANWSKKEGFEHRRAESMMKGVPSDSSGSGGLPLQGRDGEGGGLVIDLANLDAELDRVAEEKVLDILHPDRYERRVQATRQWARTFIQPELTTVANVIREAVIANGKGDREWNVRSLAEARRRRIERRLQIGAAMMAGSQAA
jgi:Trehalose synthase, N-terminal domain